VVNMHLGDCLGGYNFFEQGYETSLTEPRFIDKGEVTSNVFNEDSRILEINSKSGLYPLYMAYSIYRARVASLLTSPSSIEDEQKIWDKVVAENIFVICKTPMAKSITKRTLIGFRKAKVNTRYFEDLINQIKNKPEHFIKQVEKFVSERIGIKDMKFNAVVGNPPYQEEGISTRKAPIYHLFYDISFKLSNKVTLITPGRFLFKAGQTPKEWMDKILEDKHFKVVRYFSKSTDVFPTVDIKGGVVISYRDANKDFGTIGFFSSYPELKSILLKVHSHKDFRKEEFSDMISSQGLYKFSPAAFVEYPEIQTIQGQGTASKITSRSLDKLPSIFMSEVPDDKHAYVQMIGLCESRRAVKWIKSSNLQPVKSLEYYKVFVAEANGSGTLGETLSTPFIGVPMVGHTDTFLTIGMFESENEALGCLKYIKTKFARTLLGTLKATQHNPRDTWANIPNQDFTNQSDIDWNKSIHEIDQQLYAKYNLSEDEIEFIEKMIKPM
ncbi:MAG: Eco57I restriction-modification methylase domain-containing protein, partial [Paludibacteraceae bacterium]|nr:Eco57I restriction-modification methylase domain-containing protein [Paludibacteraceae bacterium]